MRDTIIVVVGILVCLVLGPNLPPMVALDKVVNANKNLFLVIFISGFVVGIFSMIGLLMEMNARFGQFTDSNEEAAQVIADVKANTPGAYWQKWKYKFKGESTTGSFQMQVPIRDLKDGFKEGTWTADPVLLRVVLIAVAACVMMLGICGMVFVMANVGIKMVLLVAVGYAVMRTIQAWTSA